ncbi:MAG: beta-glycosidase [Tannerellaceae bacterium]|jgi:glucosylceramidase|nr:beta-glycosidase [Tannerellaceae bacterium]
MNVKSLTLGISALCCFSCANNQKMEWVSTMDNSFWNICQPIESAQTTEQIDILVDTKKAQQTIDGFGLCFSELGWEALNLLDSKDKESILQNFFTSSGANFTICRMPIGASDFALDWYSFNENEGDFEMENFTIDNDRKTLIPLINDAKKHYPDLKIWASPWSPPSWMKYNKHYASRSTAAMARRIANLPKRTDGESTYMQIIIDNGLPEEKNHLGREGTDMFIMEDNYLEAYARYFSKFIDAYKQEGIDIFMVAPQNEFNSAQIFPSCCWTAAGLTRFIGNHLGPAMKERGVDIMFGTMERGNEALVDTALTDTEAKKYITTVGFQWAGKDAIPGIHARYPDMKLYQTEQECGNGKNDWEGAIYSWELMKHYLNNGVSCYNYWNIALKQGGLSRWGWAQNSLVVVDEEDRTYQYTPEYYIMKHVSHYVLPGAKKLEVSGPSKEDVLAFINQDHSVVLIAGNESEAAKTLHINIDGAIFSPELKASSINTFVLK